MADFLVEQMCLSPTFNSMYRLDSIGTSKIMDEFGVTEDEARSTLGQITARKRVDLVERMGFSTRHITINFQLFLFDAFL